MFNFLAKIKEKGNQGKQKYNNVMILPDKNK
jgi:hypothetical protein